MLKSAAQRRLKETEKIDEVKEKDKKEREMPGQNSQTRKVHSQESNTLNSAELNEQHNMR